MTEAGLRIFKKKKKRTRKCLFEKAPKKNCKCADETSERERMRERMKEARESIEGKTYKREREGEGEREKEHCNITHNCLKKKKKANEIINTISAF